MKPVVLLAMQANAAERAIWLQALSAALPQVEWVTDPDVQRDGRDQIEVAVVANPAPGSLQGLPALRFVQSLWAGVDRLLGDPTVPDCVIARMVDPVLAQAMGQTALWATLSLHRGFFAYAQQQADSQWVQREQRQVSEVPVLLLGLGEMGRAAAHAISAQGYPLRAWTLSGQPDPQLPQVQVSSGEQGLRRELASAQIVINLLPLTPQTRGLINAQFLEQLQPSAGLINLARGAHVVDADLLAALDSGRLAHAVLDVFQVEPLPAEHRYWRHPKVTVLPHVAALTDPRSAAQVVAEQLQRWWAGQPVRFQVERARGY